MYGIELWKSTYGTQKNYRKKLINFGFTTLKYNTSLYSIQRDKIINKIKKIAYVYTMCYHVNAYKILMNHP